MRARTVALVLAVFALAVVAVWLTAQRVTLEALAPAETTAPPRAIITAPVERRALAETIVSRGVVVVERTIHVGAPALLDRVPVVVAIDVVPGDMVREGERLLDISGRPVIYLWGKIPQYRSLGPSDSGEDVKQLQRALARLGLFEHDIDGIFGEKTSMAVADLYLRHGYTPVSGSDDEGAVTDAQDRVQAATEAVRIAEDSREQALVGQADAIAAAEAGVNEAVNELEASELAADNAIAESQLWLEQAQEFLDTLTEDAGAGEADLAVARTELLAAESALAEAQLAKIHAVESHSDRLAIAQSALDSARTQGTAPEDAAVTNAKRELSDTIDARSAATRAAGAIVPLGEIVFGPDAALPVLDVTVEVGSYVGDNERLISLATDKPSLRVPISPIEASLLHADSEVLVGSDDTGSMAEGTLEDIRLNAIDANDPAPGGLAIVSSSSLTLEMVGDSLRVVFVIATTPEAVVVPTAAIWSSGAGGTFVTKFDGTNRSEVEVAVVNAVGGLTAITDASGRLLEGDEVIVSE